MATYKLQALKSEEIVGNGGFNYMAVITADHLTVTATNTAQDLVLATIPIGATIQKVAVRLKVPFKDVSDPAFNSTAFILGDAGSANRLITSAQLNENGTEITYPSITNTAYQYTAATDLVANFASMAAKALNNLDVGEVHIFVQLVDTKPLADAKQASVITTK